MLVNICQTLTFVGKHDTILLSRKEKGAEMSLQKIYKDGKTGWNYKGVGYEFIVYYKSDYGEVLQVKYFKSRDKAIEFLKKKGVSNV
jgi:hypothetical protein